MGLQSVGAPAPGSAEDTVAVKATGSPKTAVAGALTSAVVVPTLRTVCVTALDALAAKLASPA